MNARMTGKSLIGGNTASMAPFTFYLSLQVELLPSYDGLAHVFLVSFSWIGFIGIFGAAFEITSTGSVVCNIHYQRYSLTMK